MKKGELKLRLLAREVDVKTVTEVMKLYDEIEYWKHLHAESLENREIEKMLKSKSNDKLLIFYSGGLKEEMERELLDFMSKYEFNFIGSLMGMQKQIRELEFESKYFNNPQ